MLSLQNSLLTKRAVDGIILKKLVLSNILLVVNSNNVLFKVDIL